jgi:hypothetical protein
MPTHARDNQSNGPHGQGNPCADHEVTLLKNGHRWRLVCAAGEEPELLEAVSELAEADDIDFDWFDAALIAHELKRRVHAAIESFTGSPPKPRPRRR